MKFDIQELYQNISTKTKTIILVLGLFLVLSLLFIYLQYVNTRNFIAESQHAYSERVFSVYTKTLERVQKFYYNRGLANLNSFGIADALSRHDSTFLLESSTSRWQVLHHENQYLNSMAFYDEQGRLLTHLGKRPKEYLSLAVLSLSTLSGSFWSKDEFTYRIVIPSMGKGYIIFSIDPKYFLAEIFELMKIESYIILNQEKGWHILSLSDAPNSPFPIFLRQHGSTLPKFFQKDQALFIIHRISGQDVLGENSFNIVLFQNITSDQDRLKKTIYQGLFLTIILGTYALILLHYGFEVLIQRLEESNIKLQCSEKELRLLNQNLEKRVEKEIELKLKKEREAKEKERMLIHQSKLASMGEMIGNIAHQWRQPLTQLSSILVTIELLYEHKKLTFKQFKDKIREAEEQTEFMSKTIDDFRNFFKSDKQKEVFSIKDRVQSILNLISSSLIEKNITVNIDIVQDTEVYGFPNEFSQAVMNILLNAKDILICRKVNNPMIHLIIDKYDQKARIQISDNGGGILIEPIEKVFEPYVSTKHASSGTGIGLYMSKIIIEKNMGGSLYVINTKEGASFTIFI